MVLGRAFGFRHAPFLGRRLLQHRPHRGAAQAHRLDEVPGRPRAVGVLVAVFHLVARRLLDADLRPVRVELIGDHHRQRGARCARSHLGAGRDDCHDAVGRDRDEHMRVADRLVGHRLGAGWIRRRRGDRGKLRCDDEAAGCRDALDHAAPADIEDDGCFVCAMNGHVTLPSRRRERPLRCAGSSRSGRGFPT